MSYCGNMCSQLTLINAETQANVIKKKLMQIFNRVLKISDWWINIYQKLLNSSINIWYIDMLGLFFKGGNSIILEYVYK